MIANGMSDATAAKQDAGNASLASIDGKTPALVGGATPVSAAALPLPAGAATEATIAALLVAAQAIQAAAAALNGKTTAVNTGAIAGTVALDTPTLAALEAISVQNLPSVQPISADALPLPAGAARAADVAAVVTALGSPMQAGSAVAVSNFPATQPVTLTTAPLPAGAATAPLQSAKLAALQQLHADLVAPVDASQPDAQRIVGNADGDFAGQDLLELLMDPATGLQLQVAVANPAKLDAQRAAVQSDAPAPIQIVGPIGAIVIIDTTGYQSLNITAVTLAANVQASDDGITWQALTGAPRLLGAYVTAVTAGAGFSFPCIARYIRLLLTTAGVGVAYLRAQAWQANYTTTVPTLTAQNNVAQLAGTAPVTAGVAGTLAVGGNVAPGSAPTANPLLVGGADGNNLVRRLLTDTVGRVQTAVSAVDNYGQVRSLGVLSGAAAASNLPALAVAEVSVFEGQSIIELLAQMLTELRINNQYLFEIPRLLNAGNSSPDDPGAFRSDPTFFN
jgi:hypothetical protein